MLITLAFRNLWRNRRRTLITAASVMFAVFFAVFMESLQRGAWDHMLNNVVNFYYGYAQVHGAGYWDDQSLDYAFALDNELRREIAAAPGVRGMTPRIESFALASAGDHTTGVLVVGTDPAAENELTKLADKVTAGRYWTGNDAAGALVAEGVAGQLGIGLGDTLVLISQGYHGANAAGKYPVTGLLRFGSPDLNKRMVYLPLGEAQYFFAAEGLVTTLALHLDDQDDVAAAVGSLRQRLDTARYEIMDWQELIPDLVEARSLDAASNRLVLFVLYLIIAFGIFGAILMMTKERQYEFGVLVAIGMRRGKLARTVWLEILLMGLLGVLAGAALALPVVYYFFRHPIDLTVMGEEAVKAYEKFGMEPVLPTTVNPTIFLMQALIILLITSLLALYPLWNIRRLRPVEAMK